MIHVLDRQVEFIFVVLALAAELGTTIGENAQQRNTVFFIEGQHPIVEQIGGHQGVFTIIKFGEGDLGVSVFC